jgi:[ribosomal protein S5]-alanine N-acetyltransferase
LSAIETFETRRMTAERPRVEHDDLLEVLGRDPRVMATLDGVQPPEEVRRRLDRDLQHWRRHGFGPWIFRDRQTNEFVGRGGLRRVELAGREETEVRYAVVADRWGQGLASEMAAASVEVAFDRLGLQELVAFTLTTNQASRRVMRNAGFAYERDFERAGRPHVLYRLPAPAR